MATLPFMPDKAVKKHREPLSGARRLAGIVVVTSDGEAAALARSRGAVVLEDAVEGINAALGIAVAHLEQAGMLVVPSDLPQLTSGHIDDVCRRLPDGRAVAVVSSNDGGTNLLACRPANAIAPSFGPESFARHCAAAEKVGIAPLTIRAAELARDIDTPEDLERVRRLLAA